MRLETVGDVIAVRKLRLLDDSGREIQVKLGKPQPSSDLPGVEEYFCPFQITGAGDEQVRYAAGVDAFQAIQLTLKLIGSELLRLNKKLDGNLHWECDESGGFGFPTFEG